MIGNRRSGSGAVALLAVMSIATRWARFAAARLPRISAAASSISRLSTFARIERCSSLDSDAMSAATDTFTLPDSTA